MVLSIFTDGGCLNNGYPNAKAAWSFVIYNGTNFVHSAHGRVIQGEFGEEPPSNNRAEFRGLLHAFEWIMIQDSGSSLLLEPIHIYTDSKIAHDTITDWYDGWEKKGIIHKKKNPILIKEVMAAYRSVSLSAPVKLLHCRSHQPEPSDPKAKFIWAGNEAADAKCTELLEQEP